MRLFVHQLRAEQLEFWRSREAAIFVFMFPLLLLILLGAVYGTGTYRGHSVRDYLVAGLIGYGAANTGFVGLGISLVIRREYGILKRIRSTPLPAATYIAAVLVSTAIVFALQTVAMFVLGRAAYGSHFPGHLVSLALALLLGVGSFSGIGLAAAALVRSAEGSSAVFNLVLLPMAFLSGSFGPTRHYPTALRLISDVLPLKYLLDVVNGIYLDGEQIWSNPGAVAVLAAWGLAGIAIAARRFKWEPQRSAQG